MTLQLKKIKASEFKRRMANHPPLEVIDVREPAEFQSEKLESSRNIPLSSLNNRPSFHLPSQR